MTDVIAVLGLGAMGLPIAARLAERWEVRGFDVSAQRRDLAAADGVRPVATVRAAVAGATHVVVAVRDGAQLEAALFGGDGAGDSLAPGAAVIITSTVGSAVVNDVAARLGERGVGTVDAPVSGGAVRARAGDLLITAGGSHEVLERCDAVLHAMASTVVVMGGVGDGQNMKAVNQLLCGIHTAAAAEALAMADAMGLDLDLCVDTLNRGAAASFMLADRGPRMVQQLRGEKPELRSRVDVIAKDMGIVGELTRGHQLPTAVAQAAENLYRMAKKAGLDAEDDSAIATFLANGPIH
ncbi:NAD(P)-dependent oxidoreductase [Tessaracoccus sp. Y36]